MNAVTQEAPGAVSGAERSRERLLEGLRRDLGAFCLNALGDDDVKELMLNPDGSIWVDTYSNGMFDTGERMAASKSMKLMTTVAAMLGVVVTPDEPVLEGELPLDGSRFAGLIPPITEQPCFAIRKKPSKVFTLDDYVRDGSLSPSHCAVIRQAIKSRKNILVVGGTGTGKTTFLNACIDHVAVATPKDRIILIEDTREIQCKVANAVPMRSNARKNMFALLRITLRFSPRRILCGEVRGGEALFMLDMWNTGHPGGLATVHADSSEEGLDRIQQLAYRGLENGAGAEFVPVLVGKVVDIVVYIEKDESVPAGRRVKEVAAVERFDLASRQYVVSQVK